MKNVLVFVILFAVSIGSGLQMSTRIIDKIHIVTIVGYDLVDKDKMRGTLVIPVFSPDKTVKNVTFSSTSSLIYENRAKLNAESSRPLLSGKLDVALMSEELARKGIMDYLDNLERDPTVGSRVNLAIVDGSTKKMLEQDYEDLPTGLYFSSMIEHNIKTGELPRTNLHVFTKRYFQEGMDPILPLLKQNGNKVQIEGVALFKRDKYVGKIPYQKAMNFTMMLEKFSRGEFTINKKGKPVAAIENIVSNRNIVVNQLYPTPKITIKVKSNGFIREHKGKAVVDEKTLLKLQKMMKKQVESDGEKMIAKFQELNIDPLGIGQAVKANDRQWNRQKWRDQYPHIQINVKADIRISEAGVIK